MISCHDYQDELAHIKDMIDAFGGNAYASLGIIAKTNEDAKMLYTLLSADYNVHLVSPESTRFENGVTVTSVQMSKGLEFDEVIIPDANSGKYDGEYDRSLLYIACTRAMHRLTLLWTGKRSALIGAV
jgi:DNA helicase-2/ATP-dependent DNA helicase PcrA